MTAIISDNAAPAAMAATPAIPAASRATLESMPGNDSNTSNTDSNNDSDDDCDNDRRTQLNDRYPRQHQQVPLLLKPLPLLQQQRTSPPSPVTVGQAFHRQ